MVASAATVAASARALGDEVAAVMRHAGSAGPVPPKASVWAWVEIMPLMVLRPVLLTATRHLRVCHAQVAKGVDMARNIQCIVVAWAALAWFGRTLGRVGVREVPPLHVWGLFCRFPLPKVIHTEHCLDATDLGRRQKGRLWVQAGANERRRQDNEQQRPAHGDGQAHGQEVVWSIRHATLTAVGTCTTGTTRHKS